MGTGYMEQAQLTQQRERESLNWILKGEEELNEGLKKNYMEE